MNSNANHVSFQISVLNCGLILLDALNNFDGGIRMVTGVNGTAGIWATYPQDFVSIPTALGDQVSLTYLSVDLY